MNIYARPTQCHKPPKERRPDIAGLIKKGSWWLIDPPLPRMMGAFSDVLSRRMMASSCVWAGNIDRIVLITANQPTPPQRNPSQKALLRETNG